MSTAPYPSDGASKTDALPQHLAEDRQIHVIVSVLSGTQQAQTYYDSTLSPLLSKHNIQHTLHKTASTQTIIELTKDIFLPQARQGIQQTIILLSGDGGLIDIINTLASDVTTNLEPKISGHSYSKPTICLIPHGTGNALAWSSKIGTDPLEVMLQGKTKPVPMFRATLSPGTKLVINEGTELEDIIETEPDSGNPQIYGAVVFSWGLHASLVARSDTKEYRKHGSERFRMVAGDLLKENHAYSGTIKIQPQGSTEWQLLSNPNPSDTQATTTPTTSTSPSNEQTSSTAQPTSNTTTTTQNLHSNKLSYLATTLVSNLEQTYTISPSQLPLTDQMHTIYIPHLPSPEIAQLTFLPYKGGQHIHDPRVVYLPIDALRIEMDEPDPQWREICVDGKILRIDQGGWAQVNRLKGTSVVDIIAPASL